MLGNILFIINFRFSYNGVSSKRIAKQTLMEIN